MAKNVILSSPLKRDLTVYEGLIGNGRHPTIAYGGLGDEASVSVSTVLALALITTALGQGAYAALDDGNNSSDLHNYLGGGPSNITSTSNLTSVDGVLYNQSGGVVNPNAIKGGQKTKVSEIASKEVVSSGISNSALPSTAKSDVYGFVTNTTENSNVTARVLNQTTGDVVAELKNISLINDGVNNWFNEEIYLGDNPYTLDVEFVSDGDMLQCLVNGTIAKIYGSNDTLKAINLSVPSQNISFNYIPSVSTPSITDVYSSLVANETTGIKNLLAFDMTTDMETNSTVYRVNNTGALEEVFNNETFSLQKIFNLTVKNGENNFSIVAHNPLGQKDSYWLNMTVDLNPVELSNFSAVVSNNNTDLSIGSERDKISTYEILVDGVSLGVNDTLSDNDIDYLYKNATEGKNQNIEIIATSENGVISSINGTATVDRTAPDLLSSEVNKINDTAAEINALFNEYTDVQLYAHNESESNKTLIATNNTSSADGINHLSEILVNGLAAGITYFTVSATDSFGNTRNYSVGSFNSKNDGNDNPPASGGGGGGGGSGGGGGGGGLGGPKEPKENIFRTYTLMTDFSANDEAKYGVESVDGNTIIGYLECETKQSIGSAVMLQYLYGPAQHTLSATGNGLDGEESLDEMYNRLIGAEHLNHIIIGLGALNENMAKTASYIAYLPNFDGDLNDLDAFAINYNYKTDVSELLNTKVYFDKAEKMWAMKIPLSLDGASNNIVYGFSPKVSEGGSVTEDLNSHETLAEQVEDTTFQTTEPSGVSKSAGAELPVTPSMAIGLISGAFGVAGLVGRGMIKAYNESKKK